jgi:hypothetical protein
VSPDAANAEAEQLLEQVREVEAWGELQDVEADMLRKLTDLRRAIAGEVKDAEGVEAVRATLRAMFEGFELLKVDLPYTEDQLIHNYTDGYLEGMREILRERAAWAKTLGLRDDQLAAVTASLSSLAEVQPVSGKPYLIQIIPRAEVIEGYDESLRPTLRREPLQHAEKNDAKGLTT